MASPDLGNQCCKQSIYLSENFTSSFELSKMWFLHWKNMEENLYFSRTVLI